MRCAGKRHNKARASTSASPFLKIKKGSYGPTGGLKTTRWTLLWSVLDYNDFPFTLLIRIVTPSHGSLSHSQSINHLLDAASRLITCPSSSHTMSHQKSVSLLSTCLCLACPCSPSHAMTSVRQPFASMRVLHACHDELPGSKRSNSYHGSSHINMWRAALESPEIK